MARPRILFLFSDEHRADTAGFAGNDIVRTPTLDWLAEDGVVFDNAYTPSPICVPSRQCVMAGQFPRNCGCEGWVDLEPNYPTYPRYFTRYGYRTAGFGKMHLQGPDQLQGFQERPAGDISCLKVLDRVDGVPGPDFTDPLNLRPTSPKWSSEKEIRRAGPGPEHPRDSIALTAFEQWVDGNLCGTWYDRHLGDMPALLYLGLLEPHYPYQTRESLFRYYINRVQPFEVEEPFDHPFLGKSPATPDRCLDGWETPAREVQRGRAAYYGMVETMDERCGKALDALREAGEDLDDWIIIYSSDHGEMLGEHGIWEKQKFFEGSARVPLIIRAPKHLPRGTRVSANVNLCDLFATLCDLCDMPVPEGLDSRSLVPLARGEAEDWDDETCSFYYGQTIQNVMIKRGALKYQWYGHKGGEPDPEVLFDLQVDPLETRNLIAEEAYTDQLPGFRRRLAELGYGPQAGR